MADARAIPSLPEMLPVAEIEGERQKERERDRDRQRQRKKEMTWLPPFLPTVPTASQKSGDREPGKCRMQGLGSRGMEWV